MSNEHERFSAGRPPVEIEPNKGGGDVSDLVLRRSHEGLARGPAVAGGTHLFEGKPDGRQSADPTMPTSRLRPRYRALTDEEKALHDAIKAKAAELEALFEQVKPGRYASLGMTALEQAVMWTVKELTS